MVELLGRIRRKRKRRRRSEVGDDLSNDELWENEESVGTKT